MKKALITFSLLMLTAIFTTAVFADTYAQKGESWEIEYAIQWADTYEVLSSGTLSFTNTANRQVSLEDWAKKQLGWSSTTKQVRVDGKMRKQRLLLSCRKIS
jgi:hypothetical protein